MVSFVRVISQVRNPTDIVVGNFHAQLLFNSDDEMVKVKELVKGMVKRAIALGGTCTGEHGVGIGKREYLYEELGYGTVELMKMIKRTIDPYNLFNPGKVCHALVLVWNCLVLSSCSCIQTYHPTMLEEAPALVSNVIHTENELFKSKYRYHT